MTVKPAAELLDLRRDHHHALVLAERCLRAVAPDGGRALINETWAMAQAAFPYELEPHFVVEERLVLPPLEVAGESEAVNRTLREHARLRELIALDADPAVVREFGELLRDHVRFEERDLFLKVTAVLSPAELVAVSAASMEIATADRRSRQPLEAGKKPG